MRWGSCSGTQSAGVLRAVFDGLISYLIWYTYRHTFVTLHVAQHYGQLATATGERPRRHDCPCSNSDAHRATCRAYTP